MHPALRGAWAEAGNWRIGRYVVLPDHIHLFYAPGAWPPPSLWVAFWKSLVARETGLRGIWQESFWDTQLRLHESCGAKGNYVQQNPVRDGLVQDESDWPYQGEMEILEWHNRLEGGRPRP